MVSLLVHAECNGELYEHNVFVYCDLCEREVRHGEILVVDESPSAFSR